MPRWHFGAMCTAFIAALLLSAGAPVSAQLAPVLFETPVPSIEGWSLERPATHALPGESRFMLEQLRYDRVRDARVLTRFALKQLFHERGIRYPAEEVYLRAFKRERVLELWVRGEGATEFALLKTYAVCAQSGELGPKRRQGDMQVPEGFYHVNMFNPRSGYHLSLGVDYPNRRDRTVASGGRLGGDIFIHGGCRSEGCLAVTDDGIRELYWVAVEARSAGQNRIPVHIFPSRLEPLDLQILQQTFAHSPELTRFWATLQPGYEFFEKHRRPPEMGVSANGEYVVRGFAELSRPEPDADRDPTGRRLRTGPLPLGTPVETE
jgi:murein L,D-transpeptidase YafK